VIFARAFDFAKTLFDCGDIFVSPGSSVTIEAGTVLMFESFTGLHVQGLYMLKVNRTNQSYSPLKMINSGILVQLWMQHHLIGME
jgi:hypothetical protein